jgi:Ca-activated chloride channel family protein
MATERKTRIVALGALLIALFVLASSAKAAGLLIADGGLGGVLEIKEQTVAVTINGGIAVTTVNQVFQNTEDRQVEALYTFPVPKGASVANFSMWINGKEMVGEVLEKKRAREIYNSYKQQRRDPGLLEQVDYRTFEMRVFPIGPRAEQRVQITYYQELDFDHDWATYVYPLASTTRKDVNQKTTGKFALTLEAKSDIPIVAMESPSHPNDFAVAKHSDSSYQASLETRGGDLGRDLVLAYHLSRPKTGIDVITSKQNGEDGYFSLTLTAGEELAGKVAQGMDYVFLLDISGSMNDDNKLELSRGSLAAFIKALSPEDRFEVMTFNVQAQTLFKQITPVNDETRKQAVAFLGDQKARGGTVLKPAVEAAYRYADPQRPLNVIVLSDGLTEQQERAPLIAAIRARPTNSRVFCIGVGNDVNRGLLEQLADDSGGLASFLSREDNFDRQAQAFRRKLTKPVATDIKIDVAGVEAYDLEPQKLANLYHGMPLRLYGRYRAAGNGKITLSGKIGDMPITKTVEIPFPKEDGGNPQIERMWAWHRVQRLLKEADAQGDRKPALEEIVRLGEGYSIATEYTSFLVLENDAEFARWKIKRQNLLRLARDRKGQEALAANLEAMRNKARADIGPAAVEEPKLASVTPTASQLPAVQTGAPNPTPGGQSRDLFDGGGSRGGGAIDPISGAIVIGLGALAVAARRRRLAA